MESRLTDLEIRLTHQEAALEEMSLAFIRQEREIEELRDEVKRLQRQLLALGASNVASEAEETPPPHY
jgi:SlyX protein